MKTRFLTELTNFGTSKKCTAQDSITAQPTNS
jgi:hypothetical protein